MGDRTPGLDGRAEKDCFLNVLSNLVTTAANCRVVAGGNHMSVSPWNENSFFVLNAIGNGKILL